MQPVSRKAENANWNVKLDCSCSIQIGFFIMKKKKKFDTVLTKDLLHKGFGCYCIENREGKQRQHHQGVVSVLVPVPWARVIQLQWEAQAVSASWETRQPALECISSSGLLSWA